MHSIDVLNIIKMFKIIINLYLHNSSIFIYKYFVFLKIYLFTIEFLHFPPSARRGSLCCDIMHFVLHCCMMISVVCGRGKWHGEISNFKTISSIFSKNKKKYIIIFTHLVHRATHSADIHINGYIQLRINSLLWTTSLIVYHLFF